MSDSSEEYINMCKKAVEVQEWWCPGSGDSVYHFQRGLSEISSDRILEDAITKPYAYVWLPTQSQLQDMVNDKVEYNVFELFTYIEEWLIDMTGDSYAYIHFDKIPYKTMEQIWLAYIMHRNHGKQWNGSEWEGS